MAISFENWVSQLVDYPDLNAKFINTLSFLEYVGARKILKSQDASKISVELLTHIAEEIRHAHVLKKLALKISRGKLVSYADEHLLCAREARLYVQTVDRAAVEELDSQDSWKNYLYTTLLLEERAKKIYPFYDRAMEKFDFPRVFNGILKEEETHLDSICSSLDQMPEIDENKLSIIRRREDLAFASFMESLEKIFAGEPAERVPRLMI